MPKEPKPTGRPRTAAPSATNRLLELRLRAGWTQEEMAERLGCSSSHAHRLETGKRSLNQRLLLAAARAFGVSPREVLTAGEATPEPDELRASRIARGMAPADRELWLRLGEALVAKC